MKTNKNQETMNKIDKMDLSQNARNIINNTDFNCIYELFELFGNIDEKEIEEFISENYWQVNIYMLHYKSSKELENKIKFEKDGIRLWEKNWLSY